MTVTGGPSCSIRVGRVVYTDPFPQAWSSANTQRGKTWLLGGGELVPVG